MKLRSLFPIMISLLSAPLMASTNFDSLNSLTQNNFKLLAKDFTAAASYNVSPGEPLGLTGFDIGIETTATQLDNDAIWKQSGADISVLPVPKLHLIKGLPADFNIGISFAAVPNSDIQLIGGELSYAFVSGNTLIPAVALRATYSQLSGVDQLDLSTENLELTVSKGFLNLTPYVGIGRVWGDATPHVGTLTSVSVSEEKYFGGLNINFGLMNFAIEADRVGKDASVSGKVGVRF